MKDIEKKLKEIANCISEYKKEDDIGLYSGLTGILMFIAYYNRYFGDTGSKKTMNRLLNECCEEICSGSYYTPYCSGLSGALYALEHLNKYGFIDIDLSEVHKGYTNLLSLSIDIFSREFNFDFLHGATGVALYLLKYGNSSDLDIVAKYIRKLDTTAEKGNGCVKWLSDISVDPGRTYNIALSHGMSSIAIFLSNCLERDLEPKLSKRLLIGITNYILQQEISCSKYGSYFPYYSIEGDGQNLQKSRMAWCYGDLGIATALRIAGDVLNNESLKDKAIEVMLYATDRSDLESNLVMDAGICHGSAGIAQIFKRMYYTTHNSKFLSANKYWIEETLKLSKWDSDSLAGYKSWEGVEKGWEPNYSFLKGISGIGLALLAYLGNEKDSAWDEILLLS